MRAERGMTLVELVIAMPISLLVIMAALTVVGTTQRSEQSTRERTEALRQQQGGLERMTRELRHATVFRFLTSQSVEFDTFVRSSGTTVVRRVRYDCSSSVRCVRREGPAGGPVGTRATTLIEGLENPDVFEPEPNFVSPTYVGVDAQVRVAPDRSLITLRDGVDLRNLTSRY